MRQLAALLLVPLTAFGLVSCEALLPAEGGGSSGGGGSKSYDDGGRSSGSAQNAGLVVAGTPNPLAITDAGPVSVTLALTEATPKNGGMLLVAAVPEGIVEVTNQLRPAAGSTRIEDLVLTPRDVPAGTRQPVRVELFFVDLARGESVVTLDVWDAAAAPADVAAYCRANPGKVQAGGGGVFGR